MAFATPSLRRLVITAAALAVPATAALGASPAAAVGCDRFVASGGSDSNPGTLTAPYASVQRLVNSLSAGQTGCVGSGSFSGDVTIRHGGASGAPIVLTSQPGASAQVVGRINIMQGSNFINVSNLSLDGRNSDGPGGIALPSPSVDANDISFTNNDVTNDHSAICFDLGWIGDSNYPGGFPAARVDLERNRIHDCGTSNNKMHGIYVENITGAHIAYNEIYNNADRGIQLYPNAQGSTVDHNIIDSNGEGVLFSGDFGDASSNNTITQNVISNSQHGDDVWSWYPSGNPTGTNNTVANNCVVAGPGGAIDTSAGGVTLGSNTTAASAQYADPASHNFHMAPTSPCLAVTGDIAAAVDGSVATVPAAGTSTPVSTSSTPTSTSSSSGTTSRTTTSTTTTTSRHHHARAVISSAHRKHHRRKKHHRARKHLRTRAHRAAH